MSNSTKKNTPKSKPAKQVLAQSKAKAPVKQAQTTKTMLATNPKQARPAIQMARVGPAYGGGRQQPHFQGLAPSMRRHTDNDHNAKNVSASEGMRRKLVDYLDPTQRDLAESKYLHLLADPANAEVVGVPLAVGGLAPTSVKVRLYSENIMFADAAGNVTLSMINSSGPQAFNQPQFGSTTIEEVWHNHLPRVFKLAAPPYAKSISSGICAVIHQGNTPPYGQPVPYAPPLWETIGYPSAGLSYDQSMGRVVATQVCITPISPGVITSGSGLVVQSNDMGGVTLNNASYEDLAKLQAADRNSAPLATFIDGVAWWLTRFPQDPEDVNWLPTDYTNLTDGFLVPDTEIADIWGVFAARGCQPGQAFTVKIWNVLEYRSNRYAFATPNVASDSAVSMVSPLANHLPTIHHPDDHQALVAAAMARGEVERRGPNHAKGLFAWLSDIAAPVGRIAKAVLPGLLGMATSALSEGAIPAPLVAGIANGVINFDPLSGVEPIRRIEGPPRIEEIDDDANTTVSHVSSLASRATPSPARGMSSKSGEPCEAPTTCTCGLCEKHTSPKPGFEHFVVK